MGKAQISLSRKVQTIPYENISINYGREFEEDEENVYDVFREVRDFVNDMLEDEFERMHIPRKGPI